MQPLHKNVVKTNKERFKLGAERLRDKRAAWDKYADQSVAHFETLKAKCVEQKLFENIYVVDSRKAEKTKHHLPHIAVFFGRHPLGYSEFNSTKLASEGGCSLTIAQSVIGNVIVTYRPFTSALAELDENISSQTYITRRGHLPTLLLKNSPRSFSHMHKFLLFMERLG